MNTDTRDRFIHLWRRHFGAAELPIAFWYSDDAGNRRLAALPKGHSCAIAELARAARGEKVVFDAESTRCGGAKKYFGFDARLREGFEHFLSCGIPGKLEGERYKQSPQLVREIMSKAPDFTAPAKYIVFKRWDRLTQADEPEVVVFFARPDVLSGLFTLAGFDEADPNAVISPFGAGCATIVQYPCLEARAKRPRCVLGMFDVSARPCVEQEALTFAAPMKKFERMIENMDESFLITRSWDKVKSRFPHQEG